MQLHVARTDDRLASMLRRLLPLFALPFILACASIAPDGTKLPRAGAFLFWGPEEQLLGYRHADLIFPHHRVAHGQTIRALPEAATWDIRFRHEKKNWTTDSFMKTNRVAGLLVLHRGHIVLERYALELKPDDKWQSFSLTKSITATLIGAAIRDGFIQSLDDPVTRYLPRLKDSAYEGVSIRHLLTMSSGVAWREAYLDPTSEVAQFGRIVLARGPDPVMRLMRSLKRAHPPGTTFNYNTGETSLAGFLLAAAVGKDLAQYLSEKIWAHGMEGDASWMVDMKGREIGGCCLSMRLRDAGRFGQFMLEGGATVLPPDWAAQATRKQIDSDNGKLGYGYMWWTRPKGGYAALGFFGQTLFVDPEKDLVIVSLSAWREAAGDKEFNLMDAYFSAVAAAASGGAISASK